MRECQHRGGVRSTKVNTETGKGVVLRVCNHPDQKGASCVDTEEDRQERRGAQCIVCESCPLHTAKEIPLLSIVMPMNKRRDSVKMTVVALKMMHEDIADRVEIIVCDNEESHSTQGENIRALMDTANGIFRCKYINFHDYTGTAVGKQKAIEAASGDFILCMDSHCLIPPGVIRRLLHFYETNPTTNDLYHGPILSDALRKPDGQRDYAGVHLEPAWRNGTYGVWGCSELDEHSEPKEILASGMGLFSCRKEAWPGFDPDSRGFGVEEFTLHQKFHMRGDKVVLLPWLQWWHLFGHLEQEPPVTEPAVIVENYIRANVQTGVPELEAMRQHLVFQMNRVGPLEFTHILNKVRPATGIGDKIALFTQKTGIDKIAQRAAEYIGSPDCGCHGTREQINNVQKKITDVYASAKRGCVNLVNGVMQLALPQPKKPELLALENKANEIRPGSGVVGESV